MTPAERMTALQVLADAYEEAGETYKRELVRAALSEERKDAACRAHFSAREETSGASTPVHREGRR